MVFYNFKLNKMIYTLYKRDLTINLKIISFVLDLIKRKK